MLVQENGKYVFAKKLYEIAKYLGFEGWFINEETTHGHISEWAQFIKEFNGYAEADGNHDMEIQWYNADNTPSADILKSHKNTSQFLEYGSVGDYRSQAPEFNCTAGDVYKKSFIAVFKQCMQACVALVSTLERPSLKTDMWAL